MNAPTTDRLKVHAEHQERVLGFVEEARAEGARILCGGGRPSRLPDHLAGGSFVEPTVVVDLPVEEYDGDFRPGLCVHGRTPGP